MTAATAPSFFEFLEVPLKNRAPLHFHRWRRRIVERVGSEVNLRRLLPSTEEPSNDKIGCSDCIDYRFYKFRITL
ncbi:MAG: hypothetical protein DWH94_00970 [Planctomycetota bacterium]|nr:MAG: hypothetical protein DWH94_00970 [Planctomycetota bacterium]RLS98665.1 MAG: hypothetical protein DWI13_02495 [Planctomycetota bacterium]